MVNLVLAPHLRPGTGSSRQGSPAAPITGWAYGLLMFAATASVMCWQLGRPALWLDEAASVVATQRSWPGLWVLLRGPDAPLVPYYAVLKVVAQATRAVVPGLTAHPEVLDRWPSAAAMALACALLIGWLSRTCPPRLLLAVGVMLLVTGGVSRYGQEARGYAGDMLLAVVATMLWVRLATGYRRRWVAGYALAVALMVVLQPLTAALVAGHLVAAVLLPDRSDRRPAVVRTLLAAAAGLLAAAPRVVTAITYGRAALVPACPHRLQDRGQAVADGDRAGRAARAASRTSMAARSCSVWSCSSSAHRRRSISWPSSRARSWPSRTAVRDREASRMPIPAVTKSSKAGTSSSSTRGSARSVACQSPNTASTEAAPAPISSCARVASASASLPATSGIASRKVAAAAARPRARRAARCRSDPGLRRSGSARRPARPARSPGGTIGGRADRAGRSR